MKTATQTPASCAVNPSANGGQRVETTCCQEAAARFEACRQKALGFTETALNYVREHPIRSLVGAFEVGVIVGLLRRRNR